jgi:crotonobetainyl-CoA:carnitine CoA-transferase CaiB-like acyl-CoA transferase
MLSKGALTGIRVLDLSRMLPGPYCSMILADHGADVIAIEDRRFQGEGLFFNDLTRNKRHMTLNLKNNNGLEVFRKMATEADVIIEGFRPGVVARLGVDYQTIQEFNPRIIYCSITGYGQTGPLRDQVGHDANYISRAGLLNLIGEKDRLPCIPGVQMADIAGGSMNAAIGILLALFAREKTGQGQYIDISMTDGVVGFLSLPYFFKEVNKTSPKASDTMLSHRYGCYNTYATQDGRWLTIAAVENRFWRILCEHLGVPEFGALQYDDSKKDQIICRLREIFTTKTLRAWEAELSELEVCFAAGAGLDEVLKDSLFCEREMVHSYLTESGETRYGFGIPVKLSTTPGSIRTTPCSFGKNTSEILAELGYSEKEIASLIADGAV